MTAPIGGQSRLRRESQDDVVLRLAGLQKYFGAVRAVEAVDLEVKRNQLVTLLGPSGCGKTTTLRMIAGFEYPTAGKIFIDGIDVTDRPPHRREIGLVFQSYSLFPHLRVADNVGYGLKRRGVGRDERAERVKAMLDLVDLAAYCDRYPSELSGGQQQRVALARAIVISPKVLLLDEPLSALDAKLRQRMRLEIRQLQREIGMTTILVTHDQEEALSMSDRIVVMNGGFVEQSGTPAEIYRRPKTPFVAGFVGETNLFYGRVNPSLETLGHLVFTADSGFEACFTGDGTLLPNDRILISLRPETLSIEPAEAFIPTAKNMLQGKVMGVSYLGSRTLWQIRSASSELLVSRQNHMNVEADRPERFREGDTVTVSWAAQSCQVIKAE